VAAFIAAQREDRGISQAVACRALGVSPAWFYKWRHGDPSPQHARRARLGIEVARLFAAHQGRYGAPRITADLGAAGERVSENTVAQLMREPGLQARPKRRRTNTTRPGRSQRRAPDLIGRDFAAEALNQKWYGDGTEIATGEGKLYLASVLDMGSRRIVGFALDEHHDAELAYHALAMAVAVRGGRQAITGVIFHNDRLRPRSTPPAPSARPAPGWGSGSRWAGSALDNAVIESWHATLEFELRRDRRFATRARARRAVAAWIDEYNHDRRHSALGMRSPIAYEQALLEQPPGQAA
jgi:putative transposase